MTESAETGGLSLPSTVPRVMDIVKNAPKVFPENMGETKVLGEDKKHPLTEAQEELKKSVSAAMEKKSVKHTDKERLDHLQKFLDRMDYQCVCRWALTGDGFVIHPSNTHEKARPNIREAIDRFIEDGGVARSHDDGYHGDGLPKSFRKRDTD